MVLNSSERRGALVILLLLALGTAYDLWRARRPLAPLARAPLAPESGAPSAPPRDSLAATAGKGDQGAPLDLNRAGAAELDGLPGIGPVLARRIVDHRRLHGPFRRVEELRAVRGVGPRLLARIAPRVTIGGVESPEP